ncbi:MAG: universal stress protein [Gammaproteobacteria bacterium]|nr:universal stress protein [Gammaproteobacteria bacterium]MDE2346166.1 universal stress protein [Gammaproteobacteria bacterium]
MANRSCIMVILDRGLHNSPALLRATALARKSGDRLLLALFEYDPALARAAARDFDLDAYLQGRRSKLEEFAGNLSREGLQVDARYFWGRPLLARILLAVLAEKPQMVFKDVRGEPALRRLLFTTLDLDLLRQCPEPLMLVRASPGVLPRHMLAAVDPLDEHDRPHELNTRILDMAKRLCMQCDAQVDVVHVFEYMPFPVDPEVLSGWTPDVSLIQKLRDLHTSALQTLCEQSGIPSTQAHMLEGEPGRAIAEYAAARHCDTVIMGTVQRSGFERLAMGSVAERLLDQLDCDVLALKPDGFRERLQADLEKSRLELN